MKSPAPRCVRVVTLFSPEPGHREPIDPIDGAPFPYDTL